MLRTQFTQRGRLSTAERASPAKSAYASGYRSSYTGKDSAVGENDLSRGPRDKSPALRDPNARRRRETPGNSSRKIICLGIQAEFVSSARPPSSAIRHPIDHGRAIYARELTVTPLRDVRVRVPMCVYVCKYVCNTYARRRRPCC